VEKTKNATVTSEEAHEKEMVKLKKYFDLKEIGKRTYPCTLVEKHGRILIWHLPQMLSNNRMVSIDLYDLMLELINL
jgi:hypothetical protein